MQARPRMPNWVDLQIAAHYQENCRFVVADRYIVAVGGLHQGNVGPNNNPIKCLDIDVAQPPLNPPDRFFCPIPTNDSIVQVLPRLRDFSACFDGKNKIVIFGGLNNLNIISDEVYVITLQEQDDIRGRYVNCKRQVTFNNDNCGRFGHTAHIYLNTMYVIGGTTQNGQNNFQILKLSLTTPYTWERVNIPQESPHDTLNVTRWNSGHKSILKDGKIYVYNGDERYPIQHINEHLFVMNLANQQLRWERIQAPSLNPRQEPLKIDEMLEMNNKLYFFERNPETQLTSPLKIHSYDIRQNRWDLAVVGQPQGMPINFKLIAYQGRFILWGYDQQRQLPFNGRIFSLNLDGNNFPQLPQITRQIQQSLNWNQRHQQAPRHGDSSLVVVGKYIVAVGGHQRGIGIYDPRANAFQPVAFTADSANLNIVQFSVCAYKENKIIIFGGRTNINITNTVFVISLQEDERGIFANCKVHNTINNNDTRAGHSAHIYENTMYVIGGEAGFGGDNNLILKLSLNAPYTWESVNIPNDNPNWAHSHKSVLRNGKIYIYTEDLRFPIRYVNENLYVMDLTEQQLKWRKVQAPSLISPMEPLNFNDMLEIDNKLHFFERNPPGELTYPKNIHTYNLATNQWGRIGIGCPDQVPINFKSVAYHDQIILWEILNQNNVLNGIIYSLNLGGNNPYQIPNYPIKIRDLRQEQQRHVQELQNTQRNLANRDARIRALENDKTGLENGLRNIDNNIRGLEEEKQNLEREIVAEENRMKDLRTKMRNDQFQLERSRIEDEMNSLRAQLPALEDQIEDSEHENRILQGQLNNARSQHTDVERRTRESQRRLDSVRSRCTSEESRLQELERELKELIQINQQDLSTIVEDETELTNRNLGNEKEELETRIKSYAFWLVLLLIGLMSLLYRKL